MSNNPTAELVSQILAYYSTPVGASPGFNSLATGNELGVAVTVLQTATGFAQMVGVKLSNPVTLGVPLTALAVDIRSMNASYIRYGTVAVSDIYSAAANLSAVVGGLAVIAAAGSIAVPAAVGLAVAATAAGIGLTAMQLAAKDQTIDVDTLMSDLKQTVQGAIGIVGDGLTDAINALSASLLDASDVLSTLQYDLAQSFIKGALGLGGAINNVEQGVASFWTAAQTWVLHRDPLTFDLDGDGLETVGVSTTNPILFDHDGTGVKTATGWVLPDDGFLVLDRNGNGQIDNGTELFGDATPLYDASGNLIGKAADGFAALAAQDTNGDGAVNSGDANFTNLRIWRDLNQDGVSQTGELFTLGSLNISSINVASTANSQLLANGNQVADLGSYTKTDGSTALLGETAQLGDVNLAQNTFISQFTDSIPLTAAAAASPDMQGSGQVRELRQVASMGNAQAAVLQQALDAYSSAATHDEQMAQLDGLILSWSDTSTMATTATGAYTGHPLTITFAGIDPASADSTAWLNKLTTLEHFNGRTFRIVPTGTDPVTVAFSAQQMDLLNQSYIALKDSVYGALVLQTRLKPYFDANSFVLRSWFDLHDRQAANEAVFEMRRVG